MESNVFILSKNAQIQNKQKNSNTKTKNKQSNQKNSINTEETVPQNNLEQRYFCPCLAITGGDPNPADIYLLKVNIETLEQGVKFVHQCLYH